MKRFRWTLIIGLFVAIVFTTSLYLYKFGSLNFSENRGDWGSFGDYIGGVLGTTLAALTIYLLIETYISQNAQLKIQLSDSIIRYIDLQYDQILRDINDITFRDKTGSDALYSWDDSNKEKPNNVVNTLNFILHTFNSHIETISNSNLDTSIKDNFKNRAFLMWHSKIIWPSLSKIYDDIAFKNHTDNLYHNFNESIRKTYNYLVPREMLASPDDLRILAIMSI